MSDSADNHAQSNPIMAGWLLLADHPFPQLSAQLAELGWRRMPDPTAPEPLIPGEPELAEWRRNHDAASAARLVYTFTPASGLRTLLIELPRGEARLYDDLRRSLPHLSVADVAALLRDDSGDARATLRGIQAAALLRAPALIAPLNQLLGSANHTLAREARAALADLIGQAGQDAATLLKGLEDRAASSERGQTNAFNRAIFAALADARQKCQALRWMLRRHSGATPEIEALLETALRNADWELRATAMLVAGRLGARRLANAVRGVELPASQRAGLDADDRRILAGLRTAVLKLLAGEPVPEQTTSPTSDREAMTRHMLRCAAGVPVLHHDRVFLMAYSLTTPFDTEDSPAPPALPFGVSAHDGAYWLGELELIWVPPATGWLGDELSGPALANPIHSYQGSGFLIARLPVLEGGAPRLFTHDQARLECARLAADHGVAVRMPSPDEWELAARGTDGRRFPWGNALVPHPARELSPWGLAAIVGVAAQWCRAGDRPVLCGGVDQLRCSMRKTPPAHDTQAALRVVVGV